MSATRLQDSAFRGDKKFWDQYIKGRPVFPDSFFDRVYEYHASHNGLFAKVHDAGSGGGLHSSRLAKKFSHVLVSDPGEQNINTAKLHLSGEGKDRFSYRVAKFENIDGLDAASVDMVFLSCMIHMTDLSEAFKAISHQLKVGGTMVLVLACIPYFNREAEVQHAFQEFFSTASGRVISAASRAAPGSLEATCEMTSSAYDSIAIPEALFEPRAQRVKLNWPEGKPYYRPMLIPPSLESEYPHISRIGASDEEIKESDPGWSFQANVDQIADIYHSFPFPSLEDDEMKPLWQAVQDAVEERTVDAIWPVTMILATRK